MRKIILILVVTLISIYAEQGKRPITPEDLWRMYRIASLHVSSDKSFAVFTQSEYNINENKGYTDIYKIDLTSFENKKLTTHKAGESSPILSIDGKKLAFISKREDDDKGQIYILPMDGGESERITSMPFGVSSIKWHPNGKEIFFASNVYLGFEKDMKSLEAEIKKRKENKVSAFVTENRFYRYWDSWLSKDVVTHLFKVNIDTKEVTNLTEGFSKIMSLSGSGADYDISDDGSKIVFSANVTPPPYKDELTFNLFTVTTDGKGKVTNLFESQVSCSNPKFSSDGLKIFYKYSDEENFPGQNTYLAYYDLPNKTINNITNEIDLSIGEYQLSSNDDKIFFNSDHDGKVKVFSYNLFTKQLDEISNTGTSANIQVLTDGLVLLNQNFYTPPRIVKIDENKRMNEIYNPNKQILDSLLFGEYENIYFEGANGDQVQMFLLYPPGFTPDKKWGLLHLIHGGPHMAFSEDFHFRWNAQMFASMGYVIAMVNFHGSTGFGERFATSIVGAHGDKPYTDIMLATDYLLKKYSWIDSTKMAAAGGSYGGYLVNWIAGQTNRFKTLISHAGVYNFMGQFASDLTHFREKSYGGSPWYNKEYLHRWNPSEFAENFNTPMLIIHGEKDYRVVVTQGLELFGVLQGKGIESRLIYFPDENHWILQPQNSVFWYKEINDWLKRFLK